MLRALRIIGKTAAVIVLVCIFVFLGARYGWRLFGFKMCESPKVVYVDTIYVTDKNVSVCGNTASSASAYVGFTYKVRDDALYLGIKQNLLLGFLERYGGFSFKIEDDFSDLKAVFVTNGEESKQVWDVEKDGKYLEK
ncbi:MAG: hypothetical protein IJ285_05005 [Clostridia bacterium]|nr:hypothetical protein [Oscillospiraceae bacterium]MBQ7960560.1 hypothetical protein [Clostridia bacterium]